MTSIAKRSSHVRVCLRLNDTVERNAVREIFRQLKMRGYDLSFESEPHPDLVCSSPAEEPTVLLLVDVDGRGTRPENDSDISPASITLGVLSRRAASMDSGVSNESLGSLDGYLYKDELSVRTLLPWLKLATLSDQSEKSVDPAVQYLARSIFSFQLPIDPMTSGPLLSSAPLGAGIKLKKKSQRLRGRVLIADDTASSREFLEGLLERAGADVVSVSDGAQAVTTALNESFDLIVMDAEMPTLTGYEAISKLRMSGLKVPIVAFTAHFHRSDLYKCIEAGANRFVSKLSTKEEILEALSHFVGDSLTSDEGDKNGAAVVPFAENPRIARAALKYLRKSAKTST